MMDDNAADDVIDPAARRNTHAGGCVCVCVWMGVCIHMPSVCPGRGTVVRITPGNLNHASRITLVPE